MSRLSLIALFFGALLFSAHASTHFASETLWQNLARNADLSILSSLIQKAGLKPLFNEEIPNSPQLTLFAPTDAAFKALNLTGITSPQLLQILQFHVLSSVVSSTDIYDGLVDTDASGNQKRFNVYDLNGAFRYMINGKANILISRANQPATNGILHPIDSVLLIPTGPSNMTLNDAIAADPRFTILNKALSVAGLGFTFFQWTVFAPTNAAFQALPEPVLNALLENPSLLQDVLLNHCVQYSVIFSGGLVDGETLRTNIPTGSYVRVSVSRIGVNINDANVISANEIHTNGVIHAIDRVLLPN